MDLILVGMKDKNVRLPLPAYHGPGWQPRTRTLTEEVRMGTLWAPGGADSEWGRLAHAALCFPDPGWPCPGNWQLVQYRSAVDFGILRNELAAYRDVLEGLGVTVTTLPAPSLETGQGPARPLYNGCFMRDQFLAVPGGAVVGRMASEPRAGEERHVALGLAKVGVPILRTISGSGTFECSDALWLRPDLLVIGTGNRTDASGAHQVTQAMTEWGVRVLTVDMPRRVQHLLGLLQIVAPGSAVLRVSCAPTALTQILDECGIRVLELPESTEVTYGQAMNFVTIGEREVIMIAGCPVVRGMLEEFGVRVRAVVKGDELVKAAGGLACATGVVQRAPATGSRHG